MFTAQHICRSANIIIITINYNRLFFCLLALQRGTQINYARFVTMPRCTEQKHINVRGRNVVYICSSDAGNGIYIHRPYEYIYSYVYMCMFNTQSKPLRYENIYLNLLKGPFQFKTMKMTNNHQESADRSFASAGSFC